MTQPRPPENMSDITTVSAEIDQANELLESAYANILTIRALQFGKINLSEIEQAAVTKKLQRISSLCRRLNNEIEESRDRHEENC